MLENKVVVVTGAGGVLCSTMAERLAELGCKVALLDLDKTRADSVSQRINDKGGEAIGLEANVLIKSSLVEAKSKVNEAFGPVDILVNGAGGNHPKGTTSKTHFHLEDLDNEEEITTFFDLDPESIKFVFDLNFMGTLLPCQIFTKDMVGREDCSIVNVSSMNAFTPLTKIPAYSGAKAAVSNFTQWMAVHFAKVGIRVNALAPGFFLTDQNRRLLTEESGELTPRGNTIVEHTPMGRFGSPEDLLGTLQWLIGPGASFVTGITVPIDGGFSAFSGV